MGWFSGLLGEAAAEPIAAVGEAVDGLFTSDDERLSRKEAMARVKQRPALARAAIMKAEAQHRSWWVAGGRPAILWVAAVALLFYYVPQYAVAAYVWAATCLERGEVVAYPVSADGLLELVLALAVPAGLRTVEKLKGRAK